ncbi:MULTISPECIES: hypothetical protein [unclassified Paraburkholderia]|uniref:hypothetical protein n=1 Tax=unclassified Paraburkholderia TaxID=2615204 RepID=UPI002AAF5500|nr:MULTISPECIES: hypothetical protein [unclassified Paraburkholderia]
MKFSLNKLLSERVCPIISREARTAGSLSDQLDHPREIIGGVTLSASNVAYSYQGFSRTGCGSPLVKPGHRRTQPQY